MMMISRTFRLDHASSKETCPSRFALHIKANVQHVNDGFDGCSCMRNKPRLDVLHRHRVQ